jgi:hypothetical protein
MLGELIKDIIHRCWASFSLGGLQIRDCIRPVGGYHSGFVLLECTEHSRDSGVAAGQAWRFAGVSWRVLAL